MASGVAAIGDSDDESRRTLASDMLTSAWPAVLGGLSTLLALSESDAMTQTLVEKTLFYSLQHF